jgi:sacsin
MYPEGPSILSELIQNADDSGATTVKVLISMKENGTSSLLGPKMSSWQGERVRGTIVSRLPTAPPFSNVLLILPSLLAAGPAIYVYNNSTFSDRDFINLSRIGQASKLDKLITTGRFGLGFNAVFHWTDVPSFVSGDYLVMFDPHERYVPGATSTSRGIKIKFKGSDLLDQFPDQFEPYKKFGCDMKNKFKGTLFRFPLRTSVTAADSEISKTTFDEAAIRELVSTFEEKVSKMLLFLRNVKEVQVFAEGGDGVNNAPTKVLYSAKVGERKAVGGGKQKWSAVSDFITGGSALQPLSKVRERECGELSD